MCVVYFMLREFLSKILIKIAMDDLELMSCMGKTLKIFVLSTSIWTTSMAGMLEN